jgi:hypothetical protein
VAAGGAGGVRVNGLKELVRDFRKVERGLGREIRREIKSIAKIVSDEARRIALAKGLRDSGDLIKMTKPAIRGSTGLVRSSATRRGYPYPFIYEYGKRGASKTGPRAWVNPALDAKQDEVVEAFEDVLDKITSRAGLGRGGAL